MKIKTQKTIENKSTLHGKTQNKMYLKIETPYKR
jgi:hypothetical protein